jgi:predicted RNA-binding Zn ribbon-like protein
MRITAMDLLWAELINSDWHDYRGSGAREDRLENGPWLRAFLERAGCPSDTLPSPGEREALRGLRTLLRGLLEAFRAGRPLPVDGLLELNRILAEAPVIRRLERTPAGARLATVPGAQGLRPLLGEIAASFARLLVEGDPARVKVCANPDCGWVIYDESRNLSRRWCDAAECGNLIKVRMHRQRRRGGT